MRQLIAPISSAGFTSLYIGVIIGWMYWIWLSIQFDSFIMFVCGLLGPVGIFASLTGLWSLIFGVPSWLLSLVG